MPPSTPPDPFLHIGIVTEVLPNAQFRVQLENGKDVIVYTSGKMRTNKIRVVVNDRVQVLVDKYGGKASNRLVRRL